jgi:dTMP kinase
MQYINTLAGWVLGDLRPDITILLDAPVEVGMSRATKRGNPDRLDVERAEFYTRVRDCYLDLAKAEPERFVIVDASGTLDQVSALIDELAIEILKDK